jgi:hypothetical protein
LKTHFSIYDSLPRELSADALENCEGFSRRIVEIKVTRQPSVTRQHSRQSSINLQQSCPSSVTRQHSRQSSINLQQSSPSSVTLQHSRQSSVNLQQSCQHSRQSSVNLLDEGYLSSFQYPSDIPIFEPVKVEDINKNTIKVEDINKNTIKAKDINKNTIGNHLSELEIEVRVYKFTEF